MLIKPIDLKDFSKKEKEVIKKFLEKIKQAKKAEKYKQALLDIKEITKNDCNECVWLYEPKKCVGCFTLDIKQKIKEVLDANI